MATKRKKAPSGDLVFGPEFRGERVAIAVDGAPYIVESSNRGWRWFSPVDCDRVSTEAKAIAACIKHDRERRGVQPAREESR